MIKIYILLYLILLSLNSCQFVNESNKINEIIKKVEKDSNYHLSFKYENNGELYIKISSNLRNEYHSGIIIENICSNLKNAGIRLSECYLYKGNNLLYSLSYQELSIIDQLYRCMEDDLSLLVTKKYHKIFSMLSPDFQSVNYNEFTKNINKLVLDSYPNYDGFIVSTYEGKDYILFSKSKDNKYVHIVFAFDDLGKRIYGLEFN